MLQPWLAGTQASEDEQELGCVRGNRDEFRLGREQAKHRVGAGIPKAVQAVESGTRTERLDQNVRCGLRPGLAAVCLLHLKLRRHPGPRPVITCTRLSGSARHRYSHARLGFCCQIAALAPRQTPLVPDLRHPSPAAAPSVLHSTAINP